MILKVYLFVLLFAGCQSSANKNEITIRDIEIFENTPAWNLAETLEKKRFIRGNEIISENAELVNFQDPKFCTTLLMRAVSTENYEAVEFLLQNGANPNIVANTGSTALFDAVSHSWKDVTANEDPKFVKILLSYGADPNITYCAPDAEGSLSPIECGTSPLMHATQRGLKKTKLLVEAGADINYKTDLGTTAAIKALLMEKVDVAHYLIVEKKSKVTDPYYFYYLNDKNKINYNDPRKPIKLLEDWLLPLNSKEHRLKMEIVDEFKRQGQDYWSIEKHPKTIERIKKIYPNNWKEYLEYY